MDVTNCAPFDGQKRSTQMVKFTFWGSRYPNLNGGIFIKCLFLKQISAANISSCLLPTSASGVPISQACSGTIKFLKEI
jgi:hypothetical protein